MATGWKRLAHKKLSSAAVTIDSGTFAVADLLRIVVYTSGTNTETQIRFNSDTGNNYSSNRENDGGNEADFTSQSMSKNNATGDGLGTVMTATIYNRADKEKQAFCQQVASDADGASNAPRRAQGALKWANTSDRITSIQVVNNYGSGNTFAAGSYITVFAATDDSVTDEKTTLTNVPAGTRYEETDTRKIYRATIQADLDDDFSSDGWTDVGSASQGMYCGVNAGSNSGNKMYFKFARDNADQGSYYDLGTSMSDTKWLLQFKIKITQLGTGYADLYFIGLRSTATVDMGANDDSIMFVPVGHESKMRVFGNNNEGTQSGDSAEASFAFSANTDYYVELVRLSATSAKFTIRTGSHTGTSVATATATIDSGIESLRYISIHNRNGDTDTGQTLEIGEIDDMKFYNNTTTATPSKVGWKLRGSA